MADIPYHHAQFYPAPQIGHPYHPSLQGPVHVPPSGRIETVIPQRKRPKYTRSKTGCMTCRIKKVKCDETKPSCLRCQNGQRDCTWPETVNLRKKTGVKQEPLDPRTSPTDSLDRLSDMSAPSTREPSPYQREDQLALPPLGGRRHSDSMQYLPPPAPPDNGLGRRSTIPHLAHGPPTYAPAHPAATSSGLPMIPPEMQHQYHSQMRYEPEYQNMTHMVPSPMAPRAPSNTLPPLDHHPHHPHLHHSSPHHNNPHHPGPHQPQPHHPLPAVSISQWTSGVSPLAPPDSYYEPAHNRQMPEQPTATVYARPRYQ